MGQPSQRPHCLFLFEKEEISCAKYIFLTGGVVSGLGKGITAASPGLCLGMQIAAVELTEHPFSSTTRSSNPGRTGPIRCFPVF